MTDVHYEKTFLEINDCSAVYKLNLYIEALYSLSKSVVRPSHVAPRNAA